VSESPVKVAACPVNSASAVLHILQLLC